MWNVLAIFAAALALQAAPPPLTALIHYTQHLETSDGLTKTVVFEERLFRGPDRVWQERVLPERSHAVAEGPAHEEESHEGHLHPTDLATAARYVSRDAAGALHLEFVHPHGGRILAETRDYPEVGFDGSWAGACHLMDPARLAAMKPLDREAPTGARWYATASKGQFLRVLWSSQQELPLRIEAGTQDGRRLNITEVVPGPAAQTWPWEKLEGLPVRDYTDLLD